MQCLKEIWKNSGCVSEGRGEPEKSLKEQYRKLKQMTLQ